MHSRLPHSLRRDQGVKIQRLVCLAFMARGLSEQLPGLERKVRVLTDWTLELFFPRDIVQTIDFNDSGMRQRDPKVAVQ